MEARINVCKFVHILEILSIDTTPRVRIVEEN